MTKKAHPDAPVFSELHTLMEQVDNEPCAIQIPETVEGIAKVILERKGRMAEECWIIGKLLIAAKEKLTEHGEWLPWLADNVDIPDWQAERYMKLAREYPNPTALSILGLTKALELTKIPKPEREEFLQATHLVDGQAKTAVQMTSREFEKAVRGWKAPKTDDSDDDVLPLFPVFRSTRAQDDDDEDDFVRWDSASSEEFAAELEAMLIQLQGMRDYMVSKKNQGLPGKQCVEKLRVIHISVLNCMSLAGMETVK